MRIALLSVLLLGINTATVIICNGGEKAVSYETTEFDTFAKKYEACFGKKPSKQIWSLGQRTCQNACKTTCRNCSACTNK